MTTGETKMDDDRRKQIKQAITLLQKIKLDEVKQLIEDAAIGEREYFDAMPESIQNGDQGQKADGVAILLEDYVSILDEMDICSMIMDLESAI